jgi:hypothetical protein
LKAAGQGEEVHVAVFIGLAASPSNTDANGHTVISADPSAGGRPQDRGGC